jgi:hypothetical protein
MVPTGEAHLVESLPGPFSNEQPSSARIDPAET